MSGKSQVASEASMLDNRQRAQQAYGIAFPAMEQRLGFINQSLSSGEPGYMSRAFQGQRSALTEGLAQQGSVAQSQQMAGSKAALSGGNAYASLHPADIGAQLANALYGSRFAEGQANIDQQFNLMGMALGGAGTAGSGAMTAAGQQLGAIGFLPGYNQTYANIAGGAAAGASVYGMLNKYGLFSSGSPSTPAPTSGSGSYWSSGGVTMP